MSLVYEKFYKEEKDEKGILKRVELEIPDDFNFSYDVLDYLGEKNPNGRALVWIKEDDTKKEFTYKEMMEMTNRTANYLTEIGVKRGDTVMLLMKKRYEFWPTLLALHKIGAVAVPGSHMLSIEDIKYRIKVAGIKHIICAESEEKLPKVEKAVEDGNIIQNFVINEGRRNGWKSMNEDIPRYSHEFKREEHINSKNDAMLIYFTSGTTKNPRAVVHSYSYPLAHIVTAKEWHGIEPESLHFTVADSGWAKSMWGKLYGQWLVEAAVMVYDYERFDAHKVLSKIENLGVRTFCAPPSVYNLFCEVDLRDYKLDKMKHMTTAGEPLPKSTYSKIKKELGFSLYQGYGQTEMTLNTLMPHTSENNLWNSIGYFSPQYNSVIIDENKKPVGNNRIGELVITEGKNYGLLQGYLNENGKIESPYKDGLYYTGDTVKQDKNGNIFFIGRNDDVIKSSGYRISPAEIEDSIQKEFSYVKECAVVGVPDSKKGQIIKAFIVLDQSKNPNEKLKREMLEAMRDKVAGYKRPREIEFEDILPRTPSGKVKKNELKRKR